MMGLAGTVVGASAMGVSGVVKSLAESYFPSVAEGRGHRHQINAALQSQRYEAVRMWRTGSGARGTPAMGGRTSRCRSTQCGRRRVVRGSAAEPAQQRCGSGVPRGARSPLRQSDGHAAVAGDRPSRTGMDGRGEWPQAPPAKPTGMETAVRAPSGIVTFLFTDVEGSTRRWEADPDTMRAALATHDEVLRRTIETHGGWLFKHTGDGVCAAFASPRSAVDAAVAAQLALELPVRMGLATGETELRDADYFGAVLNRAARVMAAGHGGQILLADSTAGLVSGVDLMDLGPRRLRDLPTPVGVFQVRAPGLRIDFPALRAMDTSPGNLRQALTSFVGRESEVGQVQTALKAHRLVTLTGVGGVGKTRLAVAGRVRSGR